MVVAGANKAGERAHLRSLGLDADDLNKPFVGVVNSFNEMHPGHVHLRGLADGGQERRLAGRRNSL